MNSGTDNQEAFAGLKVVEFGWGIAAPLISWFLAAHGATVVRIETNTRPDVLRVSAPYKDAKPGINRSGYFAYSNGNKYSIALNLSLPKALEMAKRLLTWTDVVLDSFRIGPMEKWGLGYQDLKQINPDIIMLRTTNQGLTGPYNRQPGWGWQLVGLTGICSISGWPDREALSLGLPYTDIIAPRFGLVALIAALDYRRRTGKGQLIDLSQLETSLQFMAPVLLDYFVNENNGSRGGNASPYAAPHGVYRCKGDDRWCAITIFTDEQWDSFCSVIGNPGLKEDSQFATLLDRKRNEEKLNNIVESWTIQYSPEEVTKLMQAAEIPAGIVKNAQDVFNDVQLRERNYFWELEHPEMGPFTHLGQPFGLSETPARSHMPAPCLGEHNEYICTELLGMSDGEFLELVATGVFE
ncbi:CaiB/BaiF CoA transferase family protein [Chloroflexota bacterium]